MRPRRPACPRAGHTAQPKAHRAQHAGIQRRAASTLAGALRGTAAVVVLAVVLLPFFFVIYRLTLFGAVPGDGDARFLLGLLGLPGGAIPGSPAGYRALSVLAAVPFYYVLPPLPLANRAGRAVARSGPGHRGAGLAVAALSWPARCMRPTAWPATAPARTPAPPCWPPPCCSC